MDKKKPGYTTIHRVNGVEYVYQCVSRYDKERKQSFNKQVCIGKNGADGTFLPNRRYRELHNLDDQGNPGVITSKAIGVTGTLGMVADASGLSRALTLSLGRNDGQQVLSLAQYLLVRGTALSHYQSWAKKQKLPSGVKPISTQRISDLLDRLDAQAIEGFYRRWGKRFTGEDTVCIDSTSVSSYSQCNDYVKRGYNRDHEPLEQVNVLGVFSASQMLPVVMRMLPGNIADVSMLIKELKHFNQLGLKQPALLIDKGFDSAENITYLLDKRIKFIMMAKHSRKDRKALLQRHRESIRVPSHMFYFHDERYYGTTELLHLGSDGNRRCYAHIYYCSRLAEKKLDRFNAQLHLCYEQLLDGGELSSLPEEMQKYFTVKVTPKRGRTVILDEEQAVRTERSYSPMFLILSNKEKDPKRALSLYRERDAVEKFFDDLKNSLDMKRLRVQESSRAQARIFIQCIAAILLYLCRNALNLYESTNDGVRAVLEDLSGIYEVRNSSQYGALITEITKKQREVIAALGADPDSWLQN